MTNQNNNNDKSNQSHAGKDQHQQKPGQQTNPATADIPTFESFGQIVESAA